MNIINAIDQAIRRREKLSGITNAMRLVNGRGDGLEGLLIDRYHRHVQIQVLSGDWLEHLEEIQRSLELRMPLDFLIVKERRGLDVKSTVLKGQDPKTIVEENGLSFAVNLDDGLNCGLFLDMRHNRRMVAKACGGKKVLNAFAYTCAFGLYARHFGALEVVNIDISRKVLERGSQNYALNGLVALENEFIVADTVSYLERAVKKENHFDVVILDPPSFSRHEGKVFQVKQTLSALMQMAVAILKPKGRLFVSTNYSEISYAKLEQMLAKSLNGRKVEAIERRGQDVDFVGSNSFKESYLAGLWVKFL